MIDKIIEKLECECEKYHDFAEEDFNLEYWERYEAYKEAIEIVKKYDNDGWIDVNNALPTKSNSYLTYWRDGFGNHGFYVLYWDDGRKGFYPKWEGNQSRQEIAWRELPSPFVRREK